MGKKRISKKTMNIIHSLIFFISTFALISCLIMYLWVYTEVDERQDDLWQSIADVAYDWSRRIADAESLHASSNDFRSGIENSLYRLQLDDLVKLDR